MLAVKELLGSKLKFGLIALAIGLVVSLTMITSAMSEGLVVGMTGAKAALEADALVFQGDTYPILERSLLSATDIEDIASTEGVDGVSGVGHSFATVDSVEAPFDVRVFGLAEGLDRLPIVEGDGGLPGPDEAIADVSAQLKGVRVGDLVRITPTDHEFVIVGFTEGRRYVMVPTLYVTLETWEDVHVSSVLGRMAAEEGGSAASQAAVAERFAGSASVAAVDLADGVSVADLAERLGAGYDVAPPEAAAAEGNGMPEMILAVGGIQAASIVIGALLVGVFFYITTLHKTGQIAAIKAIGASNGYVYRQLLLQIAILVALATMLGTLIALGVGSAMPPTMAFEPQPVRWGESVAAVFATSLLGSLFSLRSILRIDPATALDRAGH